MLEKCLWNLTLKTKKEKHRLDSSMKMAQGWQWKAYQPQNGGWKDVCGGEDTLGVAHRNKHSNIESAAPVDVIEIPMIIKWKSSRATGKQECSNVEQNKRPKSH